MHPKGEPANVLSVTLSSYQFLAIIKYVLAFNPQEIAVRKIPLNIKCQIKDSNRIIVHFSFINSHTPLTSKNREIHQIGVVFGGDANHFHEIALSSEGLPTFTARCRHRRSGFEKLVIQVRPQVAIFPIFARKLNQMSIRIKGEFGDEGG